MAKTEPPRRIPRLVQSRWGGQILVVWDRGDHMAPYERDCAALLRQVIGMRGSAGMSIFTVDGVPEHVLGSPDGYRGTTLPSPTQGTTVLILSDLGALAAEPFAARRWQAYARSLQQAGASAIAWVPHSARQVEVETAQVIEVHCLDPFGSLRAERGRVGSPEHRRAEHRRLSELREALLVRTACCIRVEPELLRELRTIDAQTRREPGLEGLYWSHQPVVRSSLISRPLATDRQEDYRRRFEALPAEEQRAVWDVTKRIHAYQGRSTEVFEALVWDSHASPEAKGETDAKDVSAAREWIARFNVTVHGSSAERREARQFADDVLSRNWQDIAFQQRNSPLLAKVWAVTGRLDVPSGLSSVDIASTKGEEGAEPYSYELIQVGDSLTLRPTPKPSEFRGVSRVASAWSLAGLEWRSLSRREAQWVDLDGNPTTLARLSDVGLPLTLVAEGRRFVLDVLTRPRWASEMGRDRFGLYADLTISSKKSTVSQRFRWIEPGTFLMGSPDDEADRYDDEGPQHLVTLTQGYWLADTACTQALWLAVMGGKNPSRFTYDPGNPVERVSWTDVQKFLRKFETLVTGCSMTLPTEAQWEYACRAGTTTPFSFGENITPEQVNYAGNNPYAGGREGLDRGKTVPVKSLPPNGWGLYEMHGNVREWCADGMREYGLDTAEDPEGPMGWGESRAVRGGSGRDSGWDVRSASRNEVDASSVYSSLGFRLCLRSMELGIDDRPDGALGLEPEERAVDPHPTLEEAAPTSSAKGQAPPSRSSARKKK